MRSMRFLLPGLVAIIAALPTQAADTPDAVAQRDQQRRVMAEVEQTARRVSTTLRVLVYQRLDPTTEQKVLDEVAGGLRALGREQMTAVLTHLENAVKAPDEATATAEQREAYQKHRQVVTTLRGMLVRLDTLKSLDQAADRLSRFARDHHDLHLRALAADGRQARSRRAVSENEELADSQGDLRGEMLALVKGLATLRPSLNPEQKERLDKADAFGRGGHIVAQMEIAHQTLNAGNLRSAADTQLRTSKELQALAAALRSTRDKAAVLREARDRVEKLLQTQESLRTETENPPDPTDRRFVRGADRRVDPAREHANQLAEKQSRLEFDTRDARKAVEEASREVAAKLTPAESEMKRAEDELRSADLAEAAEPQKNAADRLRDAREELDKMLAQAEKEKSDPLAAVKKAAEAIEQLIKDQKAAQEMAQKNADKPDDLKPAADAQKDVAKKTDETRALPLPENPMARDALQKASETARQAAEDLAKKDARAADPKQSDTLKSLEAARQALEQQAAAIEKRREDIAKLDEAAKKLDQLTREEKKVADDATAKADATKGEQKPDTSDLARQQGELTPPTKDVGEMVKDAAPEAAQKVNEATKNQEMAKDELAKNEPKPGSEKANEAAKNLQAARDEVMKKADELKAKEIADQTALQPNKVNPADAAQQIAKAIEQAQAAAEQSKQAAEQLNQPMNSEPMKSAAQALAEMQKQVADRAEALEQADAAQNAADAARALDRGDLPAALDQQQKALEQLEKAAGKPNTGEPGKGQPNPAAARNPGDLAKAQQQLMQATEALQKSSEATAAAQAALSQAQAQSPMAVQPQLDQAGQQLNQAQQQLGQGQPAQAGQSQQQAAQQLGQALSALNAAAQAMGQQPAQPGQNQQAQANTQGMQPGQQPGQPGQQPGQQPGPPGQKGKQGDNPEKNEGIAEGNRQGPGQMKNIASQGKGNNGDGSFINLQKRDREKVQQNAEAAFPAEFRELIKQYNINIKNNGKPQQPAKPDAPPKK